MRCRRRAFLTLCHQPERQGDKLAALRCCPTDHLVLLCVNASGGYVLRHCENYAPCTNVLGEREPHAVPKVRGEASGVDSALAEGWHGCCHVLEALHLREGGSNGA